MRYIAAIENQALDALSRTDTVSAPVDFENLAPAQRDDLELTEMRQNTLPFVIEEDLLLTKTCLYHLGLDPSLCENFSNFSDTKNAIERVANNFSLFILLVQLTPAALLSIFLGPWCDK
ncbi:hypothetical protein MRX96_048425 [Rhipicephalus microplus]